jgi:hypothetical protein
MGQSSEPLSPQQRVEHYREMAMEVTRLAGAAHFAEMRAQYLQLAESWLTLADEVERRRMASAAQAEPLPPGAPLVH